VHRTHASLLSAVTLVAALWLGGCAAERPAAGPQSPRPTTGTMRPAMPTVAPLPAVDQLTGVLYRLADTSIPAEQKVALVQYATVDEVPALRNFGEALVASGFTPLTVDAADLRWGGDPGHVIASVTIGSPNPQVRPFTFPMEFAPIRSEWQLSKRTADQLLPLVGSEPPR
jgi:hypothetical protein